jgi:hypothetical protein
MQSPRGTSRTRPFSNASWSCESRYMWGVGLPGGGGIPLLFENYWQYGKLFPDIGPHYTLMENDTGPDRKATYEVTDAWRAWKSRGYGETKGHRHPRGTKTNEVMYLDNKGRRHFRYRRAVQACYGGTMMDYLESRQQVYVPIYRHLIRQTPAFGALAAKLARGESVMLLDYDAPEVPTRVSLGDLEKWVGEPAPFGKPFGHGYCIAWELLEMGCVT